MITRVLLLRVTLISGDDDTSLEFVDADRIHHALCKGFPNMPSDHIEVIELPEPAAPATPPEPEDPHLAVLKRIAESLDCIDGRLDAAVNGDGFLVRS